MGKTRASSSNNNFISAVNAKDDQLYRLNIGERAFLKKLWQSLAGESAGRVPLVWQNGESELLVHLSTLKFSIKPGLIIVGLSFEADQIPKSELVFVYRIADSHESLVLQAATENMPRGNQQLAASWGRVAQDQIWAAMLHAAEREQAALMPKEPLDLAGIYTDGSALRFVFSKPVNTDLIEKILQQAKDQPQHFLELKHKVFGGHPEAERFIDIGVSKKPPAPKTPPKTKPPKKPERIFRKITPEDSIRAKFRKKVITGSKAGLQVKGKTLQSSNPVKPMLEPKTESRLANKKTVSGSNTKPAKKIVAAKPGFTKPVKKKINIQSGLKTKRSAKQFIKPKPK